jgi:hypothetical protein
MMGWDVRKRVVMTDWLEVVYLLQLQRLKVDRSIDRSN